MKTYTDTKIIDFHSHILPAADHGSNGLDTSLSQLALLEKAGVDIAVATSHFYPQNETVDAFLERREKAAGELAAHKSDKIKIALGAEVYCVAGLENMDGIEKLTIKGTNTLLLEMPMAFWNTNIITTALALNERFDLVLAHIDRYPSNELSKLLDFGITAQVNAGNILKGHNKKRLYGWLGEGLVVALGSDLHGEDKKAVKAFTKAQKALKYDIDDIFSKTEELIKNAELI